MICKIIDVRAVRIDLPIGLKRECNDDTATGDSAITSFFGGESSYYVFTSWDIITLISWPPLRPNMVDPTRQCSCFSVSPSFSYNSCVALHLLSLDWMKSFWSLVSRWQRDSSILARISEQRCPDKHDTLWPCKGRRHESSRYIQYRDRPVM